MNNLEILYSQTLPSGGIIAIASKVTPEQLPQLASDEKPKRQCERYTWHTLAREILKDPHAQFSYNDIGAPQIVGSHLYISVSHSAMLVAVVISPQAAAVDIESLDRNFLKVASKYATPEEQRLTNSPQLLAQLWSIKEAAYKFTGRKGLDLLCDISVSSITENKFSAVVAGIQFEGVVTTMHGHTLAYIG